MRKHKQEARGINEEVGKWIRVAEITQETRGRTEQDLFSLRPLSYFSFGLISLYEVKWLQ